MLRVDVPALGADALHVWSARLDADLAVDDELLAHLSDDERDARHRFLHARDRRMFVLSHATRRLLLGAYVGAPASSLRFTTTSYGKPSLAASFGSDVRFNVSHSGDVALLAVARGREIGVDVEQIRALEDWEALAKRAFSSAERDAIRAMPEETRLDAFYACWSRKEAVIKAVGLGLSFPLDAFDVDAAPARPPRLVASRDARLVVDAWSMAPLDALSGYATALMVEGRATSITQLQWRATDPTSPTP